MIITNNKHPFYASGESSEKLKLKLAQLDKVEADPSLSKLAQNLFYKLTAIKASHRYHAADALKHPWISRNILDSIPPNFSEQMETLDIERNLKQKAQLI